LRLRPAAASAANPAPFGVPFFTTTRTLYGRARGARRRRFGRISQTRRRDGKNDRMVKGNASRALSVIVAKSGARRRRSSPKALAIALGTLPAQMPATTRDLPTGSSAR
jgi:hypothetical protein